MLTEYLCRKAELRDLGQLERERDPACEIRLVRLSGGGDLNFQVRDFEMLAELMQCCLVRLGAPVPLPHLRMQSRGVRLIDKL